MKNYASLFLIQWFDLPSPPGSGNLQGFGFTQSQQEADDFMASQPTLVFGPVRPWFVLLNKENVLLLANAFPWAFDVNGEPLTSPGTQWTMDSEEAQKWGTKAAGWNYDIADEKSVEAQEIAKKIIGIGSQKQGDLSGSQALLTFLNSLLETAAKLTKAGQIRYAGIVLYAYRQVVNQAFSITQAINYLDVNVFKPLGL